MFRSQMQFAKRSFSLGAFSTLAAAGLLCVAAPAALAESVQATKSLTLSKGEWTCLFQRLDVYLENKADPVYVVHNTACTSGLASEAPDSGAKDIAAWKPGKPFGKGQGMDEPSGMAGTAGNPPYVTIAPETIDPSQLAPVLASEGFDVPATVTKRWSTHPYDPNSKKKSGLPLVTVLSKKQLSCIKQKQVAIVANNADPRTFDFAECEK